MTACFDLEDAKRKLTPRTRAVVTMHSWGLPCEMDHIAGWCREKGLILLEDAAHAHGAEMQGKKMGGWGLMGIYSFQTTKVLPGIEGGMGMYQDREHYERATAFGNYDAPASFPADSPVRLRGDWLRAEISHASLRRGRAAAPVARAGRPERAGRAERSSAQRPARPASGSPRTTLSPRPEARLLLGEHVAP